MGCRDGVVEDLQWDKVHFCCFRCVEVHLSRRCLAVLRQLECQNNTEYNIIFGTFDDTLNGDILDDLKGWFHELTL